MNTQKTIQRGDMYLADLPVGIGSEQNGTRPVLVIQNNTGNRYSPTVIIAAITGHVKRKYLPCHVCLKAENGLRKDSTVLLEQLRTLDRTRLKRYIGTLPDEKMQDVNAALGRSIGIQP